MALLNRGMLHPMVRYWLVDKGREAVAWRVFVATRRKKALAGMGVAFERAMEGVVNRNSGPRQHPRRGNCEHPAYACENKPSVRLPCQS